jgi:hypothetical protein
VFTDSFEPLTASAAVADETLTREEVLRCLPGLGAKSLIALEVSEGKILYRLHHTPCLRAGETARER